MSIKRIIVKFWGLRILKHNFVLLLLLIIARMQHFSTCGDNGTYRFDQYLDPFHLFNANFFLMVKDNTLNWNNVYGFLFSYIEKVTDGGWINKEACHIFVTTRCVGESSIQIFWPVVKPHIKTKLMDLEIWSERIIEKSLVQDAWVQVLAFSFDCWAFWDDYVYHIRKAYVLWSDGAGFKSLDFLPACP